MLTYNTKFLSNVSHILNPLNQLLRKNTAWTRKSKQHKAFKAAEQLLNQNPVLAHYDVKRHIKLYCDASAYGLGACLVHVMQDQSEKPVAYASRTLSKWEKVYTQIECEGLAIIFGVEDSTSFCMVVHLHWYQTIIHCARSSETSRYPNTGCY